MRSDECFSDTYLAPVKHIASGGMGDVFLANDTRLNRQVAVKRIKLNHQSDDLKIRERALYEARLMAKANHPNVVQLYDILEVGSDLLLVLEYVPGQTLAKYMKQKLLTVADKFALLEKVANGLCYIHQQELIHCDIKASNILISNTSEVKLSDFGIANSIQSNTPDQPLGASFGSLSTMSPEQLEGKPVEQSTDVFSFGVLCFEFLFGCHPFGTAKGTELAECIKHTAFIEPSSLTPDIPVEFTQLLRNMLSKSPESRPSAREVCSVLGRTLALLEVTDAEDTALLLATQELRHEPRTLIREKYVYSGFVLSVLCLIVYLGWSFLKPKSELHYALVLEPQITNSDYSERVGANLLHATIDSAIRQVIITATNAELINHREYSDIKDVADLAKATGATAVFLPEVRCEHAQCNVRLSLLSGDSQLVLGELNTQTSKDNYFAIHSIYERFATKLLGQPQQDARQSVMSTETAFFEEYLSVYHDVNIKGDLSHSNLSRALELIEQDPNYLPLYSLARDLLLERYHIDREQQYIDRLTVLLDTAPERYKSSKPYLVDRIVLAIESQQQALADDLFRRLSIYGETALSYQLKGYSFYRRHQIDKALEMYLKSVLLKPDLNSKYNLAVTYLNNGQVIESTSLLHEVVQAFPDFTRAHRLIADINMFDGHWQVAAAGYLAVLENSKSPEDYNNLSLAYLYSGEIELALSAAKQATVLSPENLAMRLNYADLLLLGEQNEQAVEQYNQVANGVREDMSVNELIAAGQAMAHLERYSDALHYLYKVIKLTTDKIEYAYGATVIFTLTGDHHSALLHYNETINGGYSSNWFNLPWFKPLCKYPQFKSSHEGLCLSGRNWATNDKYRVNE
ncbi:serine/threonine-protein kinase [Pseudoalteromonas luteoviolacea]|uniref:Protein kinase domain-containing protein n=1 Tax=Pseudoalteromonas luteoviolacea H33 TaxID=1365251 RepID=A0A167ANX3_9GAMM|nr:serine/threonine-protein kinase [Pseudoalteromonas luteoviolacea]KZN45624.1 hypothetical protein N476_25310 [Pseudoalteromonas luteoviolacea H33]KZN69727.1 hypothetical protein N477_26080 [Pseudoalteromonas luteoviolacea H33-S]